MYFSIRMGSKENLSNNLSNMSLQGFFGFPFGGTPKDAMYDHVIFVYCFLTLLKTIKNQ